MDSIKKKMEKLSNETADAESRIAHFEEIKAQNEAEADKFEEQVKKWRKKHDQRNYDQDAPVWQQVRNIQKKMQAMESAFDVCTEDLFNQVALLNSSNANFPAGIQYFTKFSFIFILFLKCLIRFFIYQI